MSWDPFAALARMDEQFDAMMRHAFAPGAQLTTEGGDLVVTLEVPGMAAGDLEVEVAGRTLTVRGERRDQARYGAFRHSLQLPDGVGSDQISADVEHGLLRLRIRDAARPAAPPTKIPVRGGDPKAIEA